MSNGRPLMVYDRPPREFSVAFPSRTPTLVCAVSDTVPDTAALRSRSYSGWPPIPAGHHSCGLSTPTTPTVTVLFSLAARDTVVLIGRPATVPDTTADTAPAESLRTTAFAVRS